MLLKSYAYGKHSIMEIVAYVKETVIIGNIFRGINVVPFKG